MSTDGSPHVDGSSSTSGSSSSTSGSASGGVAVPPTPAADPAPTLAAITATVKLPPFWPADPMVWFAQVDAHFATRRITGQKARFDHVIASLSPEVATDVRDLILNPPATEPYTGLKEQLIRRTAASEQRRLQQLFTAEELGDRKPTQLLRRMQQLLGDRASAIDTTFLRELFLQRLPPNVRMVLASTSSSASLEDLAELADKVMEVAAPSVSAVTHSPSLATEVEQLREEVSQLGKLVRKLTRVRSSSRPATRTSRRSPTPTQTITTPASDSSPDPLCWYHSKFGSQAQRCRSPCSWPLNSQAGH